MDSRKLVFKETAVIALGECIGVAAMYAIFALLGYFDRTVLLGGLIGGLVAIVNFLVMAMNMTVAADRAVRQDVKGGKSLMQMSYAIRLALMFLVLFACVKSGLCNVFAAVIPLLFVRPTITIAEFFRKPGE